MKIPLNGPPLREPITDPSGRVSHVWAGWLRTAHQRLGGDVGAIPIEHGGTGATDVQEAQTNLAVPTSARDIKAAPSGQDVNSKGQVTSTHLLSALPIDQGGTGVTTVAALRTALGVQAVTSGNTASRPTVTTVGFQYFDTTLNKPVWWNGSVWKDAAGTTV